MLGHGTIGQFAIGEVGPAPTETIGSDKWQPQAVDLHIWTRKYDVIPSDCSGMFVPAPGWVLYPLATTLDLYFAGGLYYSGDLTYPPALSNILTITNSGGYAQNANGLLVNFAGSNVFRVSDQGLLIEQAATNVVLWNRDLTNVVWTASNVTVALNQTGADGSANAASSLTATSGNGTVLQAITLANSARFQSAFVKRITGSGTINMTMDNGATWTAISVTNAYTKLSVPSQTLTNPTVGFQIVTSGDAIAVDFVQNENNAFGTSPIATTTVAVTRNADVITFKNISRFNQQTGTIVTAVISAVTGAPTTKVVLSLDDGTNNNRIQSELTTLTPSRRVVTASVSQISGGSGAVTALTPYKWAFSYATNDVRAVLNGGSVLSAGAVTLPTFTAARLSAVGGGSQLNSYLIRLTYLPVATSTTVLQTLTQ